MAGLTSFITACLGAGGGIMLLGAMAQMLPPQLVIPLHGIVQLGSNSGRAIFSWRHIHWPTLKAFLPGAAIGVVFGSLVLTRLPPSIMYLSIASFILFLCWGPKIPTIALNKTGIFMMGGVTTFLTLFIGATGPLNAAFLKQIHKDRFVIVATFACLMSFQHLFKTVAFSSAGFQLLPWLPLLASMMISGAIGTWIGLKMLKKINDQHFDLILDMVLTALALRLVWLALKSFL